MIELHPEPVSLRPILDSNLGVPFETDRPGVEFEADLRPNANRLPFIAIAVDKNAGTVIIGNLLVVIATNINSKIAGYFVTHRPVQDKLITGLIIGCRIFITNNVICHKSDMGIFGRKEAVALAKTKRGVISTKVDRVGRLKATCR